MGNVTSKNDFKHQNFVVFSSNYGINYVRRRIRIRRILSKLEKEGLDKGKFLNTIKNLKYAEESITFYVEKNLRKNTFFSKKKGEIILSSDFFSQSYEVVFRSLSDVIKNIGKKYYSVRGKKLEKILKEIDKESFFKATLGGCIVKKVNQTIIISKE